MAPDRTAGALGEEGEPDRGPDPLLPTVAGANAPVDAGLIPAGSRWVDVPFRRIGAWLAGFERRHGALRIDPSRLDPLRLDPRRRDAADPGWDVAADDGSRAWIHPPAWLALVHPAPTDPGPGSADPAAALAELGELRVSFAVLLVRRAGYAVAHVQDGGITAAKVGSRHIHGRSAAGGWSQQRYARRRGHQADEVVEAATAAAGRILADVAPEFLVTGGDRLLLAAARARLEPALRDLPVGAHLALGTPDREVLRGLPDRVLAVRVAIAG